ncbi:hypothetical protein J437_LFUL010875 [Ladona fulva]|uniref:Uncharacterized protein n=1 Tax=Ladona fulva TaxID=123851 RepID=A0A8K0K9Q4_LADFU|nr:hypothetical protein J437_LFUL010875 [Ladona fulva]
MDMARNPAQGPEMRLPVRPAPAPPKSYINNNNSKGGKPPLQRRITNVGLDWTDPWNESNESAVCRSLSAVQISNSQDEQHQKKKTPPPRPPPPRFTQTGRNQQARPTSRNNNHKLSYPLMASEKHNQDSIVWETCNQKQRPTRNKPNHTGGSKKSSPVNNGFSSTGLRETHIKTESPPPLLDLLTSSPPSSPVPSSRYGGSTGADTDSLSSDGFSKISTGNSFPAAFTIDDDPFDPFDPFGERLNGGASSGDPWAGEDPFSPSPAPRSIYSTDPFEGHWSSGKSMYQVL